MRRRRQDAAWTLEVGVRERREVDVPAVHAGSGTSRVRQQVVIGVLVGEPIADKRCPGGPGGSGPPEKFLPHPPEPLLRGLHPFLRLAQDFGRDNWYGLARTEFGQEPLFGCDGSLELDKRLSE